MSEMNSLVTLRSARWRWRTLMRLAAIAGCLGALAGWAGSVRAQQTGAMDGQDHPICQQARRISGIAENICGVLQLKGKGGDGEVWGQEKYRSLHVTFDGLADAAFVLLGEIHDNPVHHHLRAGLIAQRSYDKPSAAAVVFEHIRADQQEALGRYFTGIAEARKSWEPRDRRRPATNAAELLEVLEWDKSGWPSAGMFEPLFAIVLSLNYPIRVGDPARGQVRAVARGGLSVLPADARERMLLDRPLPTPLQDALAAQLKGSHCGMLPDAAIPGMAAAQFYRDAHLADAMIAGAAEAGSAILLAGNGHVRTDRAVPWHLRRRKPGSMILSVMLVEVQDGRDEPASYVPRDPDGNPAVDYIVFTLRAKREDPCEKMRQQMQGRKG